MKVPAATPKRLRPLKQLHAELKSTGYEGSYNNAAAFAHKGKADSQIVLRTTGRGTFVALAFEPGESFQSWNRSNLR
ncbi:hypothetical protein [Rhizobium tumorigenes]|uniref:Uncharacterized protein n=1 Tax=Rhizobium tumorigenes TaxID=2041385 RepID=A0AAF1K9N1_9HYPH|nr:hypothetical protein [Rhizobium tumorigenes]WFR98159.1 hypothetical protein PR017_20820 [Rhizobium tumorigenes]